MWLLNLTESIAKIGQFISSPPPIHQLLVKEQEIKALPDSSSKHMKLSLIYRDMANGYALKMQYSGFDYSSQIRSYNHLASVHRSLGIQLSEANKVTN